MTNDLPSPDQTGVDWEPDWKALVDAADDATFHFLKEAELDTIARAVVESLRSQQAAAGVVEVDAEELHVLAVVENAANRLAALWEPERQDAVLQALRHLFAFRSQRTAAQDQQ